jgi:hypothetical protein
VQQQQQIFIMAWLFALWVRLIRHITATEGPKVNVTFAGFSIDSDNLLIAYAIVTDDLVTQQGV